MKTFSSAKMQTFYDTLWLINGIFHFVHQVIIMVLILRQPVELYMMVFIVTTGYSIEQFDSIMLATFQLFFTHVGNGKYFHYV